MSLARLIKFSKHPSVVWFDRIAPLIALIIACIYAYHGNNIQALVWFATAILAVVLSVCSITRLMEKLLTKLVAKR